MEVNVNDVVENDGSKQLTVAIVVDHLTREIQSLENKKKSIPSPSNENWKDVLDAIRIDPQKQYHQPPLCIAIRCQSHTYRFGTFGNFSLITGKAKSGKTSFISYILSQALSKKEDTRIDVRLDAENGRIVLFDTEQSEADVANILDRARRLADVWKKDAIEAYSLRAFTPDERKLLIENYILNTVGTGMVIIDGIRDLVKDINSPEEATRISTSLLKWTEERNIHIMTVLHQNKGDNNARGHVGSELVNKAETVVSIEKKDNVMIVRPEQCRGKDFEPFAFMIDEAGLPQLLSDWSDSEDQNKNTSNPLSQSMEWHAKLIEGIFFEERSYQYGQLIEVIKDNLAKLNCRNGDNVTKRLITYYIDNSLISTKKEDGFRYPIYFKP